MLSTEMFENQVFKRKQKRVIKELKKWLGRLIEQKYT